MLSPFLMVSALVASGSFAWNTDVHNQIGFAAETFLKPHTIDILQHILEPQYGGSIGRAAAWADGYAHTDEGRFSYQWHWIDSSDHPPNTCDVSYNRDCSPGGCVVSAIANQTEILRGCIARAKSGRLANGSDLNCSYALKWIAHFFGDITQPLHASGLAAGGNGLPVTFDGHKTELHAVWDGYIVHSLANVSEFSNQSISPFFEALAAKIVTGGFSDPVSEWLSCSSPLTPIACGVRWAKESNSWTCEYVYKHTLKDTDLLSSGYAAGAYPIVELQIAKAVLRLATWLNRLVDGEDLLHEQNLLRVQ